MKKPIKLILILFISLILLELLFSIFKTKHNINYKLNIDNKTYLVNEIYKKGMYHFIIEYKNEEYSFSIKDNYKKDKKILTNIEYYKKDNVSCIYPVLKDSNIVCLKDNKLYSYEIAKDEIKDFSAKISKKYKINIVNDSTKTLGQLNIYNNLSDDTYIYIWKYNGMYSVNNKELKQLNIFDSDTYINTIGTNVGKYYIVPDYNEKYDYNKIYIYNMTNNKKKTIKLKDSISKDSYVNGIVNNKLYIFDKDELIQYEINPKHKKIKEVGNKKQGGLFYSDSFITKNIYEFKEKELKFVKIYDTNIKSDYITYNNDTYYYYKNNSLYSYDELTNKTITLLNMKMTNIIPIEDSLYFINDNTLYEYNYSKGLVKILTYDELSFNSTNRVAIYKK